MSSKISFAAASITRLFSDFGEVYQDAFCGVAHSDYSCLAIDGGNYDAASKVLNEFPPHVFLTLRFLIAAFQILIHLAHQIKYGGLFIIIFLKNSTTLTNASFFLSVD